MSIRNGHHTHTCLLLLCLQACSAAQDDSRNGVSGAGDTHTNADGWGGTGASRAGQPSSQHVASTQPSLGGAVAHESSATSTESGFVGQGGAATAVSANTSKAEQGGSPSTGGSSIRSANGGSVQGSTSGNSTAGGAVGSSQANGGTKAQSRPSTTASGTANECQLAFPGAQGFGRCAIGARGGSVYHVTNLNDSGPGSLRDAISVSRRTVVFDVSGVIKLTSRLVFKSNLTVAGQTAPGGGIVIYGDGTSFSAANHTIVRYLRFRMGINGESGKDTVGMANGHDVIWDHCSISWARDGNLDLNQESGSELYNLTLQDSIVAQGLQTHSTGGLVVNAGTSIIRSLYIDNNSRNPKARGTTQFINNVVYNWVVSGYILGDTSGRSDGALLGNYLIAGPETKGGTLDSPTPEYHVYAAGNYYDSNRDGTLNGRLLTQGDFGSATWETKPSVEFPEMPVMTATEAFQYVTDHAGASLYRDAVDSYVLRELASLGDQGKTISDEASLGLSQAVGEIPTGTPPKDTDQDGMSDAWENAQGLDPADANDRNDDQNGDGWTNLEEYINSLAQ
ncbi:MAG TPA: pectate lyase [Polyangiaceae bacterium]|nr:pectate lyase [Polyangiaceae bacterium]